MALAAHTNAACSELFEALQSSVPLGASPTKVQMRVDAVGRYAGTHGVQLDEGWHAPVKETLYRACVNDRERVYRELGRTWFTLVLTYVAGEGLSVTPNFDEPPYVPGGVRPEMYRDELSAHPVQLVPVWFPIELGGQGQNVYAFGTDAAPQLAAPVTAEPSLSAPTSPVTARFLLAPPMPLPADIMADSQRLAATTQTMAQNLVVDLLAACRETDYADVCLMATLLGDTVYAADLRLTYPDSRFSDSGTYLRGHSVAPAEYARDLELYPRPRPEFFPEA